MIYALGLAAAAVLSLALLRLLRRHIWPPASRRPVSLFGIYSPVLTWLGLDPEPGLRRVGWGQPQAAAAARSTGELVVVALWALWIGRHLMDFDPHVWPAGYEFGSQVYGFHLWDLVRECGLCGLWNGMANGGAPSFADPYSGALHPVTSLATLIAGVVNGAKITLVTSFWLAGVGQWWIAKTMGLSRWSRMFAALVATSGGYVIGRAAGGSVSLPLSTAAVGLALASALDLAVHRSRMASVRFSVVVALSLLAGHGHMQIALIFWSPWIFLLLLGPGNRPDPVWREFVLAGGLAVLLAGVFLIPALHFWPMAGRFSDPSFAASQSIEYLPLNLVIRDWSYIVSTDLGKSPYPDLNALYVGWTTVLLAILGLALRRRKDTRLLVSLSGGALTMLWIASGEPSRWLAQWTPSIGGLRHTVVMAGLAVPAVLALAGYGLDRLLELPWPRLGLGGRPEETGRRVSISTSWLLLIPLAATLRSADQFAQNFRGMSDRSEVYRAIPALRTAGLEWVSAPFGEHYWNEPAFSAGLKLTGFPSVWWWDGRDLPAPFLEASRELRETPVAAYLDEIPVYPHPENTYAFVQHGDERIPCRAFGTGGDLRVSCESQGGDLIVRENSWTGWTATVNGQGVPLEEGQWLSVPVPPGAVEVRFRYLPLDVLIGVLLTLTGIVLAVALWSRAGRTPPPNENRVSS